MSLWTRPKNEIKRIVTFNLHSYWEIFYLDLLVLLFSVLITFPLTWMMDLLEVSEPFVQFMVKNVEIPIEEHIIKQIAPFGLSNGTYDSLACAFIFFIEMSVIHLIFCLIYSHEKKRRSLQINGSSNGAAEKLELPQFVKKNTFDVEDKASLWQRAKSEIKRLLKLELTSCWEVFYVDLIFVVSSFLISIPISFLIRFLHLEKTVYTPLYEYVEQPMETLVVRPVAPSDLSEYSYRMITLCSILVLEVILFHTVCVLGYLYGRKGEDKSSEKPSKDVEGGSGCFPCGRPKEEKKKPFQKIYQSVYSLSSSSLFPTGSTEKLIDKHAFP